MIRSLWHAFRRPSLLRRLSVILVGAGLVSTLVITVWALYYTFWGAANHWDKQNRIFARGLAAAAEGDTRPEVVARKAAEVWALQFGEFAQDGVSDFERVVSYQVCMDGVGRVYATPGAPTAPLGGREVGQRVRRVNGQRWTVVTTTTTDRRTWVHVGSPDRGIWRMVRWMAKDVLGQLSLFYLGTAVLFALAARRGLLPLSRLAEGVVARSPKDLSPLQPEVSYEETKPLVDALNGLLAQTRQSLDMQRHFIADAAHELRTPLAAVGTQAHVLAQADNALERRMAHHDLQEGLDRASRLIQQLLTVARLEGGGTLSLLPVNLDALLREVAADLAPRLLEAGCDLGYFSEGPVWLTADAAGLRSAVENLLQNARKYAGEGAQVDLRLSVQGALAIIEVLDDGPGVSQEHLPRLAERFYRVPGSPALGSGLGLGIVERVAEAHGGQVSFGHGLEGRGFGVRLSLPVRGERMHAQDNVR